MVKEELIEMSGRVEDTTLTGTLAVTGVVEPSTRVRTSKKRTRPSAST